MSPPRGPAGIKLEIGYRCNLRCPFCYTDSPRHTLARTAELPDDAWLRIVDETIELGAIEAVVTGGEPLMRPRLALEAMRRMTAAGLAVSLNTNGWFVDRRLADELAALPRLLVHLSIDGAAARLHDSARGVPGSWRRAVAAASLLLERGVRLQVVHVVTPSNEADVETFLEHMWLLGAGGVRLTAVAGIGAAARAGSWTVGARRLWKLVERARRRYGDGMSIELAGTDGYAPDTGAATTLLVRPDGKVMLDSIHPFVFGDAAEDGLAAAWRRVVASRSSPALREWRNAVRDGDYAGQPVTPYLDEEIPLEQASASPPRRAARARGRLARALRRPTPQSPPDVLAAGREQVVSLALARRYEIAEVRVSETFDGWRLARVAGSGRVVRMNEPAALALTPGGSVSAGDLLERLRERHPSEPAERLERDALATVRALVAAGILLPSQAHAPQAGGASTALASRLL